MSRSPSWLIQVWSKIFGLTGPCPFSARRCCLGCATSFEHGDPVNFRARILHLLLVNIWRCAAYFFTEKSLLTAVCYVDLPGSWMVVLSLLECVDEIQPFSIQSLWIFGRSPDGDSTEATITQSRKTNKNDPNGHWACSKSSRFWRMVTHFRKVDAFYWRCAAKRMCDSYTTHITLTRHNDTTNMTRHK